MSKHDYNQPCHSATAAVRQPSRCWPKPGVVLAWLICSLASSGMARPIMQFPLDAQRVYLLKVHPETRGVTTVMFPSPIEAVHGSNVVAEDLADTYLGDFIMRFQPGSYFFSLRARISPAEGALNIVFNGKTYVLSLVADPTEGFSSVTFAQQNSTGGAAKPARVTPRIILSLLDIAKSWDKFQAYQAGAVANVLHAQCDQITQYPEFEVHLRDIWRWDDYDTLVFRCVFVNKLTRDPVYYNQRALAVRVGGTIYYASVVDASGVMPPNAGSFAYFAITGHPFGGRNNLGIDNRFTVIVPLARPGTNDPGPTAPLTPPPGKPTITPDISAPALDEAVAGATDASDAGALLQQIRALRDELQARPAPGRLQAIEREILALSVALRQGGQ